MILSTTSGAVVILSTTSDAISSCEFRPDGFVKVYTTAGTTRWFRWTHANLWREYQEVVTAHHRELVPLDNVIVPVPDEETGLPKR